MILPSGPDANAVLSLLAAAAYAISAAGASRLGERSARFALVAAWLLHLGAIATGLFAQPHRFGFAPAVSVTAWLVLTVYAVERQLFPQLEARWALGGLGSAAVLLAVFFPGEPLRGELGSPWLPLHLALGVASYGLFAAAAVHAWLMMRAEHSIRAGADPKSGLPLLTLERLTFRFAAAGFVLLSAVLLSGLLFSEQLYGRPLTFDHKTVFSILAWIVFAFLLLGRLRFGWRGRKAVRVLYTGSVLLLLAYVGSRFVLEVILRRAVS
jgi:ABC-type uncharacterized transport system permease subunit